MGATPSVKNINVTMEQVLNGTKMPVEIERWIATQDNNKTFEKETIYIDIPKGVDNGEIIILQDKGNVMQNGMKGDVKIFIQVENNTEFKRRGLDLILEKTITLKEALCGFSFDVKYITGKVYTIANPGGNVIQTGHNKLIPNLGLTRDNITGNLVIVFNIKFPEKLSESIVEELKKVEF
jgi:DnaJ family protein A protein 2